MNGEVAEAAVECLDIPVAFGVNDCNRGVGLDVEARQTENARALTSTGRPVVLFTAALAR